MITVDRSSPATPIPDTTVVDDVRPPISLARALTVGVAICTLIFVVGVGVGTWVVTGELADGLGVGVFAAAWGGPGFGLMAGGAGYTISQERVARAQERAARPASATPGGPADAPAGAWATS